MLNNNVILHMIFSHDFLTWFFHMIISYNIFIINLRLRHSLFSWYYKIFTKLQWFNVLCFNRKTDLETSHWIVLWQENKLWSISLFCVLIKRQTLKHIFFISVQKSIMSNYHHITSFFLFILHLSFCIFFVESTLNFLYFNYAYLFWFYLLLIFSLFCLN